MKQYRNAIKYFSKHPDQNTFVSVILGIGFGFMLTYPVADVHPLRWGGLFVGMAVVGYIWAGYQKTK